MCDCYHHKCEICETRIPIHIGDFLYPRSAFKVWCYQHIEDAPVEAVIFEITELAEIDVVDSDIKHFITEEDDPSDPEVWVGWKCAILGPEVGYGAHHNVPNLASEMSVSSKR